MIGVDLYMPQPQSTGPEKWLPGENGHDWDHEAYYRYIIEQTKKYKNRSKFYRMKTTEAATHVEDDSLDFVFIDADHSYEAVKEDIINWTDKVKVGGYVMGHDINWKCVRQAVSEIIGNVYTIGPDNVWYCKRMK
jgi:hypothetical protein